MTAAVAGAETLREPPVSLRALECLRTFPELLRIWEQAFESCVNNSEFAEAHRGLSRVKAALKETLDGLKSIARDMIEANKKVRAAAKPLTAAGHGTKTKRPDSTLLAEYAGDMKRQGISYESMDKLQEKRAELRENFWKAERAGRERGEGIMVSNVCDDSEKKPQSARKPKNLAAHAG